jgi:4-amino-4-deoxy-L-arabinose transferase-like glycosyltransferase
LFLWMGQQIAKHPADPYGFAVNWTTSPQPMWKAMQNPPLCSYYMAAIGSVFGWSELAMHLAFFLPAVAAVLGTFAVARRFCAQPLHAALLTLFTPAFLISATNVMCDVMLLALWIWSIECWLSGMERKQWGLLAISAALISAAALTKYFGISLVPLLAAYTIARDPRGASYLTFFIIPILALATFELWTRARYGIGLFSDAMSFSRTSTAMFRSSWLAQFLTGLSFIGGCLATAIFYLSFREQRSWLIALGIVVSCLALFYFFVPLKPEYGLGPNSTLVWIEGGLFASLGAGILVLTLVDFMRRRRDAAFWLLFLWIVGTFSFATFFNWSITGRTILPLAPAVAILLVRRFESSVVRYWRVVPAAIISLLIAGSDYRQANSARDAAYRFRDRFQAELGTKWFQSHWGFQYYMQQWGAKALDAADSEITSGDVMIVPANNSAIVPTPLDRVFTPEEISFPTMSFVSTNGRGTGAAFYSSVRGPLPWAFDRAGAEIYYVARFR